MTISNHTNNETEHNLCIIILLKRQDKYKLRVRVCPFRYKKSKTNLEI